MQFQTRAATNYGQARRWSWASRSVLSTKYRHVRAHSGVPGNEFADVGAELGWRMRCTILSWLREDLSAKNEGVPFCLHDALWWSDQLGKPDPLVDREVARPVANCGLELSVGSENVRTLSPATDDLEVHSVRRRVLADTLSKKHIDVVGLQETCTRNSTFRVCGVFHAVTSAAVSGQEGVEIWGLELFV